MARFKRSVYFDSSLKEMAKSEATTHFSVKCTNFSR